MPKQLLFNTEARAAMLRGVNIMAEAVKATLGPRGRNVGASTRGSAAPDHHQGRRDRRRRKSS